MEGWNDPPKSPRPQRADLPPRLPQRRPPRRRRAAPPRQIAYDLPLPRRRLQRLRLDWRLPTLQRQHLGCTEPRTRDARWRVRTAHRERQRHRRDVRPRRRRRRNQRTRRRDLLPEIQRRALPRHRQPRHLRRRSEAQRVPGRRTAAHRIPAKGGSNDRFYEMIGMDRAAVAYQTWRGPSPEMPLAHSPYETPRNYGFYFGPQFGQRPGVWVM